MSKIVKTTSLLTIGLILALLFLISFTFLSNITLFIPDIIKSTLNNDIEIKKANFQLSFVLRSKWLNLELPEDFTKSGWIKIEKKKQIGDIALFNISSDTSGYAIIARYQNGYWQGIFSGNDWPPCSLFEKEGIPRALYGCFNY